MVLSPANPCCFCVIRLASRGRTVCRSEDHRSDNALKWGKTQGDVAARTFFGIVQVLDVHVHVQHRRREAGLCKLQEKR